MSCQFCDLGYKRYEDDGVAYHSYKLSNGYEWDSYSAPCQTQSVRGMETYRKGALEAVNKKIAAAKETLGILKHTAQSIKKAKTPGTIARALQLTP